MVPFLAAAVLVLAPPPFAATVARVTAKQLPYSYRAGCPVAPGQLRLVRLTYWGFDGRAHRGSLVVHRTAVHDVVSVFRRVYAARFPIRRMRLVDAYRGSDDASMAADNTSAFNCRPVPGSSSWSMHAYGEAIDVNPLENPFVHGGKVDPPAGEAYLDRTPPRRGMAVEGNALVRAFDAAGWGWGGRWRSSKDYQHFSTNGR